MTPVETIMMIDASIWREEREQELAMIQAWTIAKLSRAKRIPALKELLSGKSSKPATGKELEKRRSDFKKMTAGLNIKKLIDGRNKKS